ncbi:hypothetical protein J2780_001316 [Chryseobacterium camelliae]|nr:hypothetical protein [Chryseobacterium camelliae]
MVFTTCKNLLDLLICDGLRSRRVKEWESVRVKELRITEYKERFPTHTIGGGVVVSDHSIQYLINRILHHLKA